MKTIRNIIYVGLPVFACFALSPALPTHKYRHPRALQRNAAKWLRFTTILQAAIFPVIQAGIQNPDPWLQALFNDD